jgi:hypothetical protein
MMVWDHFSVLQIFLSLLFGIGCGSNVALDYRSHPATIDLRSHLFCRQKLKFAADQLSEWQNDGDRIR